MTQVLPRTDLQVLYNAFDRELDNVELDEVSEQEFSELMRAVALQNRQEVHGHRSEHRDRERLAEVVRDSGRSSETDSLVYLERIQSNLNVENVSFYS